MKSIFKNLYIKLYIYILLEMFQILPDLPSEILIWIPEFHLDTMSYISIWNDNIIPKI